MSSFAALITTTWSPTSTFGAQIGLCLPRSSVATSVATRPSRWPSASTTSHARSMSDGLGVKVRTGVLLARSRSGTATGRPTASGSSRERQLRTRRIMVLARVHAQQSATTLAPMTSTEAAHALAPQLEADADRALDILLDSQLDPIVDMVLLSRDGVYEAKSHDGAVTFRRTGPGPDGYEVVSTRGSDPLGDQSTDRFSPLGAELSGLHPHRSENAYPYAFDTIAQLFDHPAAPDLCVIHSASHNWEDQGGHLGEHGSLGVVQARAPFVLAGKGVRHDGLVPKAARLVDVAPTIARLLGCAPHADGTYVSGQDGEARDDVLDGERPRHVVGFL